MKKPIILFMILAMLFLPALVPGVKAYAASAVTVSDIDYEALTMKVYRNGNGIVYLSTDGKKTWNELEGIREGDYILVDISWASAANDTKVYLRGDDDQTVLYFDLPKQPTGFKVKFDTVNGDFTFTGQEDATSFFWRKSTDYNWTEVSFDETTAGYTNFLSEIDKLRFKGAKIMFKTSQSAPSGNDSTDPGFRPSKEVAVSIAKYATAPSVKLNITKLTFNTKEAMEYREASSSVWKSCDKNMTLEEIAPQTLFANGGQSVTLLFRTAATEKKPCSQVGIVTIPGQKAAPVAGDDTTDLSYYYSGDYLIMKFPKASAKIAYEYCVIKDDQTFELSTAKWKTVKNTKQIKLKSKAAPTGTKIYFRTKGIAANATKKIDMELPSAYNVFTVSFPAN